MQTLRSRAAQISDRLAVGVGDRQRDRWRLLFFLRADLIVRRIGRLFLVSLPLLFRIATFLLLGLERILEVVGDCGAERRIGSRVQRLTERALSTPAKLPCRNI